MELAHRLARVSGVCFTSTPRGSRLEYGGNDAAPTAEDLDDAGANGLDARPFGDATIPDRKNPYGVAYPTKHLGSRVRTDAGPGDVLPNLKLTGYAPGALTSSVVQMADVYDPLGKTHDVVAILAFGRWDPVSAAMAEDLRSARPSRVALVAALVEGAEQGQPATPLDLDAWRLQHGIDTAWFVLASSAQLPAHDEATTPAVTLLDGRTMEIVSIQVGYSPGMKARLEAQAAEVKARPPAY